MRCAVLGDPVEHSLSPVLHRAAYAALGLDWTYDAVRVASGGLAAYVDGLGAEWRGLSLTMPLKREVVPAADLARPVDRGLGRRQHVLLDADGGRHGLNTDVPGAEAALRRGDRRHAARRAGAGRRCDGGVGAARAGRARAASGRPSPSATRPGRPTRSPRSADTRHAPELIVTALGDLGRVAADVVVSTIPATAQTDAVLAARATTSRWSSTCVYDPWPTPLGRARDAAGRTLVGGLDLLLWQAVDQVRAMTGRFDVPVAAMRAAGEARLADRARMTGLSIARVPAWTRPSLAVLVGAVVAGAGGLFVPG